MHCSLDKLHVLSCWHLQLLNQVGHEPVIIGISMVVLMTSSVDSDDCGVGLNLLNVLLGLALRASVVLGANKERHWDLLDLRDVNEWRDLFTVKPVVSVLLEPVLQAIHGPVLL